VLRIIGEVFREPEALYGAMPLGRSAGQWLSVPMVLIGIACFVVLQGRGLPPAQPARRESKGLGRGPPRRRRRLRAPRSP
jgi:prolipoprotein diacylglyceryltransferase